MRSLAAFLGDGSRIVGACLVYLPLVLVVVSCGNSESGTEAFTSVQPVRTQQIIGSNQNLTIDRSGKYDIDLVGDNNHIAVEKNNWVINFDIAGSANLVIIGTATTIERLRITRGGNNRIRVPTASGITIAEDTGLNTSVITQYSPAQD